MTHKHVFDVKETTLSNLCHVECCRLGFLVSAIRNIFVNFWSSTWLEERFIYVRLLCSDIMKHLHFPSPLNIPGEFTAHVQQPEHISSEGGDKKILWRHPSHNSLAYFPYLLVISSSPLSISLSVPFNLLSLYLYREYCLKLQTLLWVREVCHNFFWVVFIDCQPS